MLTFDGKTQLSDLKKEAIKLSFPRRCFEEPEDSDALMVVGLAGEARTGSAVVNDSLEPVWVKCYVDQCTVYLDDIVDSPAGTTWAFSALPFDADEEDLAETAAKVWKRVHPIEKRKTTVFLESVSFFYLLEKTADYALGVRDTYRYVWDESAPHGNISSSHLEPAGEQVYLISLIPNDEA